MIKEIAVTDAFTYEGQPDGTKVRVIDPYSGCQLQCPYCFQLNDAEWNKMIYVKTNIPTLLTEQIADVNDDLYIGSMCDPYMPLEEKYHLTRHCLEILSQHDHHIFVTTKSDNKLIVDDIELLKSFRYPPTVLLGLSNINQAGKGRENINISVANQLKAHGIDVWCFITPILPYIMDIEAMITELAPEMPVFFDKLRVFDQGGQQQKILSWVDHAFPQYHNEYVKLLFENDTVYYNSIYQKYKSNPRFTFLTDEWGL